MEVNPSPQQKSPYKIAFDKGAELVNGRVQLDGQRLGAVGFLEKWKLKRAIKHFETASALEPSNGAPMLFIAKIKQRLGDYEGGLNWLKKANTAEPDNAILAIETGATLGRLGKHKEAVTMLEIASRHHPNEPRIQCNLGLSYLLAGETQNALNAFETLVALEPDFPTNHKLLALAAEIASGRSSIPESEADIAKMI